MLILRQAKIAVAISQAKTIPPQVLWWFEHWGIKINKYKEKSVILQAIGIIRSKETRVVAYTRRYSSGHLIPM